MQHTIRILSLLLVLALAGCASGPQTKTQSTGTTGNDTTATTNGSGSGSASDSGATTSGTGNDNMTVTAQDCPPDCDFQRGALDDADGILAKRTVYFAFDSSKIQQEYMDLIKRHAAYLSEFPDVDVRVEGNTDERGSREYNIGLGSRRAKSVARLLQAYGAASDQIKTVSYGEEKPAVQGHDKQAWTKNRRVELAYPGHSTP